MQCHHELLGGKHDEEYRALNRVLHKVDCGMKCSCSFVATLKTPAKVVLEVCWGGGGSKGAVALGVATGRGRS